MSSGSENKALQVALEEALEAQALAIEPVHYFADGLYMREIIMPKNSLVAGRKHKFPHFFSLLKGRLWIDGLVYSAPVLLSCDAGAQRVLLALEDSVLCTIHSNPLGLRDPVDILNYYTEAV